MIWIILLALFLFIIGDLIKTGNFPDKASQFLGRFMVILAYIIFFALALLSIINGIATQVRS